MQTVHIGIDDTDSREGMCTTYLASHLVEKLRKSSVEFIDYPNLVRLNPNIPWKTRGNASIALRFMTNDIKSTFNICRELLHRFSEGKDGRADPGLVALASENIPDEVRRIAIQALSNVVRKSDAKTIIEKHASYHYSEGSGRGLIGALSAIGNTLDKDYTYELIAYRMGDHNGIRKICNKSVFEMDMSTRPTTFNNLDRLSGRILISPHGPDPILFGIRGENPQILLDAMKMLQVEEPMDRFMIFRSNQGTGEHLKSVLKSNSTRAYQSGHVTGRINTYPTITQGGHVFFSINDSEGIIKCAVYEPSGGLRKIALQLTIGDLVEIGGGMRRRSVKHESVLNIEYLRVIKLDKKVVLLNPLCNRCKKRMTSNGRGKGFKCTGCGERLMNVEKIIENIPRKVKRALYLPPESSQRHLAKPMQRYGMEKRGGFVRPTGEWFQVFTER